MKFIQVEQNDNHHLLHSRLKLSISSPVFVIFVFHAHSTSLKSLHYIHHNIRIRNLSLYQERKTQSGKMIHHEDTDVDMASNPANDPDVLNMLCPFDDHVRQQNGHKISLEMQLLLLPMWTIRSNFLDLSLPLQSVAARYLSIRHLMMEIDKAIAKRDATTPDLQFVFEEIMKLYQAYNKYTTKLLVVRRDLMRQLSLFADNADTIWENISQLAITDQHTCKVHAYCIKVAMPEYERLEENINEALTNCTSIVKCAMNYLQQIVGLAPDLRISKRCLL